MQHTLRSNDVLSAEKQKSSDIGAQTENWYSLCFPLSMSSGGRESGGVDEAEKHAGVERQRENREKGWSEDG